MTLTYISCSSDFYTFYVNVPLSLGCMIRKVSAEDIAIRGNGTGLEYMCTTRHFVYIFFNPVFQVSTAQNEINLFNNHVLIVAPVTFAPAGAMTPSAEFLFFFFFTFFHIVNLVIFHPQYRQGYLVSTIPHTILYKSFCNFANVFSIVCACAFHIILVIFFVTFFVLFDLCHFLTSDV